VAYLVDTSILARLTNRADASYQVADRAVVKLHKRAEMLHLTPQNLIEFRNAATRATIINGLGLDPAVAAAKAADFEALFPLLPETPDIFPRWKAIVASARVTGKRVHDARLVAVCHVHGVSHLLTFNTGHFTSLARLGPGIIVVHPASV